MLDLTTNKIIYIAIVIILFIIPVVLMIRELVSNKMTKNGILSFRLAVIPAMLIMIPQIGKEAPIDLWLFGASLGAFIGATFFSVTNKKKDLIFILIYGVIGIIIAFACEEFQLF